MRKLTCGLLVAGALAGVAVALRGYLQGSATSEEVVQIAFGDNTTQTLTSNTIEAQEFTDIARKLVEIGV